MNNVIILTHGWTGSSVFSALFGEAGYWLGGETVQKVDYNTFENADLVTLNRTLLRSLAPTLDHEHRFQIGDVLEIERRSAPIDEKPYRDFVATCESNRPWLWKDPRLTWTIRVWARMIDLSRTSFLILTRDHTQAWVSANMRRHVQSPRFTREYNGGITQANIAFLEERKLPYMQASFEDLLLAPEATLARMNSTFGLQLTMAQLQSVYREPLHRKSRDWKDHVLAGLIYLKNYGERDGRGKMAAAGKPATSNG